MATTLRQRSADEWWSLLTPAGVPCGPINDIADAFALAARVGLEPIATFEGAADVPTVAHPIRLSATPATYRLTPPPLNGGAR